MSQDIPDWERPYFDPGGGNPFLYYTAFGNIPEKSLPGQHYRCAGIPEGCDLRKYDRDRDPAVIEAYLGTPAGPEIEKEVRDELAERA